MKSTKLILAGILINGVFAIVNAKAMDTAEFDAILQHQNGGPGFFGSDEGITAGDTFEARAQRQATNPGSVIEADIRKAAADFRRDWNKRMDDAGASYCGRNADGGDYSNCRAMFRD